MMIARAPRLAASGVKFIDATNLFAGVEETLYTDACCHFNEIGLSMLAERIMDEVLAAQRDLQAGARARR
jgi:hypothetical protein